MKQYEPEIICPKCGHTDIGTAFCTRIFPNDYGQHDGFGEPSSLSIPGIGRLAAPPYSNPTLACYTYCLQICCQRGN